MATATFGFGSIQPVPSATEFLDIVLSRTQRKTPTVIHKNFKISRIRSFYARKVKFTSETFTEKLEAILSEFPKLNDIHPFHADLLNILYDRDHLKIALSQLATARHLIDTVSKDYVRLMKFGDSLYRCKQLKRAALGRMATIMRRQKDPLAYLEQVRQHLSRLPSIDPNTRTILICGYPNVGKSSFINKITRAEVDVQPYAFTTKSLFVGHMDYKYLRWQVIDTPGILDHPLEEMNTIEMQSVTAMAHLRACICYFMDLSEQCGYSVEAQVKLFHSIKPLFANKVVLLVINKTDVMKPEDLDPERAALLRTITDQGDVQMVTSSCYNDEGIMNVRNLACDKLLASRVEAKLRGSKINDVLNKIHLAQPVTRDDVPRLPFIPEGAKEKAGYDKEDPNRRPLERDLELQDGGAGVYNYDLRKNYLLENDEWKQDRIPELLDGKNIYDFIDPDIEEKLAALEREEERLEREGFYNSEEEMEDEEDAKTLRKAEIIRRKQKMIMNASKINKKALKNRAAIPRTAGLKKISQMEDHLGRLGLDHSTISERARDRSRAPGGPASGEEVMMRESSKARSRSRAPPKTDRREDGIMSEVARERADRVAKMAFRERNRHARAGEADRHVPESRPKHLLAGKRSNGTASHR
ncbi:GTP binding protein Nog1 [Saitoella complicata NRRL Y-17804]|uniref:Nucleolar GTP-binding protein 1 n=1 Tax=Saitoella complicata (strain BCRC 22490 / CBS 7301 / JCM 7358 / NBRC 10748 / NRRL Y-17804) TaxID=698492 RepID=A0A0E9NMS3_SAICN|nr:GTP binding protein Nog1 [Saitoella complicata NRRL Y-17804]ODQ55390.1 GTP binding protein Nog1 [Saitoella complicata NRRL Y-17804]GAO51177.1 hypothetical protein G7K_5288-t1 [Saitoella complicata NRRL Y-17804]